MDLKFVTNSEQLYSPTSSKLCDCSVDLLPSLLSPFYLPYLYQNLGPLTISPCYIRPVFFYESIYNPGFLILFLFFVKYNSLKYILHNNVMSVI